MKGKTRNHSITHEKLLSALEYNPATGVFVWKIRPAKNVSVGSIAGSSVGKYRYIRIFGEEITASRLAWFYMTGEWPERRVRFVNGKSDDCRFSNLTLFNGIAGKFDHRTQEGRKAYQNAYRLLTPVQQKARALRDSFGMSLDAYQEMLEAQNGKCAICNQPETHMRNGRIKALAVDHNHKTGAIRGLLCSDCNTAIGKLKDDPEIIRKAAQYLEHHLGHQPRRPA